MAKRLLLISILLLMNLSLFAESKKIGIAVLPFKVVGPDKSLDYLSSGIPDILITTLSQTNNLVIVERDRIKDVIEQLELNQSDVFDEKNAVRVGKLVGSKYLVAGTLTVIGERVRLDARIIDIETGKIIKGFAESADQRRYIFDAIDRLSNRIAGYLADKYPGTIDNPFHAPRLDVAFLIDSTGSMGDEIDVVRGRIREIMNTVGHGHPKPIVRFAIVDYKDETDPYITNKLNFTQDTYTLNNFLNNISASGGGDFEEAMLEGMNVALDQLSWDSSSKTSKMLFLIADAPHHVRKGLNLKTLLSKASSKEIKIYTIACSGIDENGVNHFKTIASNTKGKFDFLTYKQQYVTQSGTSKDIIVRGDEVYESEKSLSREEWGKLDENKPSSVKRKKRSKGGYKAEEHMRDVESEDSFIQKQGSIQNNLDILILDNIKKEGEKQGVIYSTTNKDYHTVEIENENMAMTVKVSDPKIIESLNKAKENKEIIWIALSIYANSDSPYGFYVRDNSLILYEEKNVPGMSKTNFKIISNDILYFENHGIMNPKRWFVQVKVKSIKKVEKE